MTAAIEKTPASLPALASRQSDKPYRLTSDLVMISHPAGPQAEAIRALRTQIVSQQVNAGRRALVVCAPNGEVGCSFVAANLAVALSQIGLNTLLLDANLRDPGVQKLIAPQGARGGLRRILEEGGAMHDEIDQQVLPNLSVLYAGEPTAGAQELLASQGYEALIDVCLRDFEFTIIDTPPANTCSDALRVVSLVSYALLVARRHLTHVNDVRLLAQQITSDGGHLVGTVLNEL